MNAIEQKKLAVIKSNAAPEVKLKALEKLGNMKPNVIIEAKKKAIVDGKAAQSDVRELLNQIESSLKAIERMYDIDDINHYAMMFKEISKSLPNW
jgi:hypothetical protein